MLPHRQLGISLAVAALTLGQQNADSVWTGKQATVLIFVRTDCPISNRYAPELRRLQAKYSSQSVAFRLVYPDERETSETVASHRKEFNLDAPAVRDPEHSLVALAHATVTPEAAVFDANRRILYHGRIDNRYEAIGRMRQSATEHDLEDAIDAVLQHRPVAKPSTRAVGCYLADLKP